MPGPRPSLETVRRATRLFGANPDELRLISAGVNTVYRAGNVALRLVSQMQKDHDYLTPPLAWLRHLHAAGASVCGPLSTPDGRWITEIQQGPEVFLATAVRWVGGPRLSDLPPTPELYRGYGVSTGRLHRAGQGFEAASATPHMLEVGESGVFARWDWLWQRAARHVVGVPVLERAFERLTPLVLAWADEDALLTHGDLRPGNVIWNTEDAAGGQAVVIDFDEPVWGPATLDLARAALELQGWQSPELIAALLEGYRQERSLSTIWDARLPLLMAARAALMAAWSVEDGEGGSGTGSGAVVSVSRLLERLEQSDF